MEHQRNCGKSVSQQELSAKDIQILLQQEHNRGDDRVPHRKSEGTPSPDRHDGHGDIPRVRIFIV